MNFTDDDLWTLYDALLIAISSVQNDINNGKYKGRPVASNPANTGNRTRWSKYDHMPAADNCND